MTFHWNVSLVDSTHAPFPANTFVSRDEDARPFHISPSSNHVTEDQAEKEANVRAIIITYALDTSLE